MSALGSGAFSQSLDPKADIRPKELSRLELPALQSFTKLLARRRNTMLGAFFNRVCLKKRVEQRQCQFSSTDTISQA
jgi:hypothetical protein